MRLERYAGIALILGLFCTSCEKEEAPIVLPPKGSADVARVNMGEEYEDQVFFDFETQQAVMTSKVSSWDLAFETGSEGYHVFVNGGKMAFVYNTHQTDIASIKTANAAVINDTSWQFDAPCGLSDSTGIGEWKGATGYSKNEVYILKFSDNTFKKIVLESVNNTSYVLKYGDINSNSLSTINIPKDPLYNYAYFSFDSGGKIVMPDPPKASWDIVFTRYRYIYYDLNDFPYLVSGPLLNPNNTEAIADSNTAFSAISYNSFISASSFSNHRDIIGFDWKRYNFNTGKYEVNQSKSYVIKTHKDQYWKLHFLDFYSLLGEKGSPSFEFERIH